MRLPFKFKLLLGVCGGRMYSICCGIAHLTVSVLWPVAVVMVSVNRQLGWLSQTVHDKFVNVVLSIPVGLYNCYHTTFLASAVYSCLCM